MKREIVLVAAFLAIVMCLIFAVIEDAFWKQADAQICVPDTSLRACHWVGGIRGELISPSGVDFVAACPAGEVAAAWGGVNIPGADVWGDLDPSEMMVNCCKIGI